MNTDKHRDTRARLHSLCSSAFICGSTLFLNGCLWNPFAGPAAPQTQPWKSDGPPEPSPTDAPIINSADPKPAAAGIRVDVFLIAVPRGAVSANEGFWKRVDEAALSQAKYDALFSNGIRVGVARRDDWPYLKKMIEDYPAKFKQLGISVASDQKFPISVREDVAQQVLSLFEPDGHLRTTTYQNCDNVINLSVAPAPRRPDAARVAFTPMVRVHAEKLELTADNRLQHAQPTYLYDLSLAAEVPVGQVLVISPSTDVALNSSIGRNFLLVDGEAEQLERVLLVVPAPNVLATPATRPAE